MTVHTLPRRRRHPQQPTAVVQAHLRWLLDRGTTRQAITARSGVSDSTVRCIFAGTRQHVRGGVAAALLALRPAPAANGGYVPSVGTIRRLRALVAFGYTTRQLAAETGVARSRGWAVPAAWDDIDDPQSTPCPPAALGYRNAINRVYSGRAHIDLLTPGQQVGLWRRWADDQTAAGLPVTATRFAARFGIDKRRASRIKAALDGGTPTNQKGAA